MNKEIWRQLIHASGIFILLLGLFLKPEILILLCVIMVFLTEILFILDKYHYIPIFSSILDRCKRNEDEKGFIYFFIGILATLIIFNFNTAIAYSAIIMLILGDSVSTIIGKRFGKHKLPYNIKTFEGSSAFIIVGFAGALTMLPLIPALTGALVGALTEAYSPVDDNIPVPIISALAMSIVIYLL